MPKAKKPHGDKEDRGDRGFKGPKAPKDSKALREKSVVSRRLTADC